MDRSKAKPKPSLGGNKKSSERWVMAIILILIIFGLSAFSCTGENSPDQSSDLPLSVSSKPVTMDHSQALLTIDYILAGEDFHQKKTVKTIPFLEDLFNNKPENRSYSLPLWIEQAILFLAQSIKWILYGVIIAIVALLIIHHEKWLHGFGIGRNPSRSIVASPQILFGLDLRRETLPEDVSTAALDLWKENKGRQALSLLYRATLIRLMAEHSCRFQKGYTEGECVGVARQQSPESLSQYFSQLAGHWQNLAYGHTMPSHETMENLCQNWSTLFNINAAT